MDSVEDKIYCLESFFSVTTAATRSRTVCALSCVAGILQFELHSFILWSNGKILQGGKSLMWSITCWIASDEDCLFGHSSHSLGNNEQLQDTVHMTE